ncbi:WD repeat-containing protein 93-like [Halichondria panicea]|uniref:WD repeat-containing protein 93-like n=1 Tax=Halichondria panicea TaxID=6063 RepID=UPI00312B2D5B
MDAVVEDSRDYLLDPELWLDKLPQPYRLVDDVLQGFLDEVWAAIERREVCKRGEEGRVKIPELSGSRLLPGSQGTTIVSSDGGGHVILGSPHGLTVCELQGGDEWESVGVYEWAESGSPTSLLVSHTTPFMWLAISFTHEVKFFTYSKNHLIHLSDISFKDEQSREVKGVSVSPCWSHVTLSTRHEGSTCSRLTLYTLPLSSWADQTERVVGGSSVSVGKQEEVVFSGTTLVYSLQPPCSLTPCPNTDPQSAMNRIGSASTGCIPSGEMHLLTEAYLCNRRTAFVAQRKHFVDEARQPLNYTPTPHFLYSSTRGGPCGLAVWWSNHNQLRVYPITASKPHPLPLKLLPQTAAIVCSVTDGDGQHMALALANGTVACWNMRTVECTQLVRPLEGDEIVTAMLFVSQELVVGTSTGRILVVSASAASAHRLGKQREVYPQLLQDSRVDHLHSDPVALPSVVLSAHSNGTVVLWSVVEQEVLCQVSLCQSPHCSRPVLTGGGQSPHCSHPALTGGGQSPHCSRPALTGGGQSPHCSRPALTGGGLCVLGTGEEDASSGVVWFDLHSAPTLSPHLTTPPIQPRPPSTVSIQDTLSLYISTRCAQFKTDRERWSKRWAELSPVY